MRTTPQPAPAPTKEELDRVLAHLGRKNFEALDQAQRGYARLLANYSRALATLTEASEALLEADPAGYRSGYCHAADGQDYTPQEDRELWDDVTEGARGIARFAEQERNGLDCSLPSSVQYLVDEDEEAEDEDEAEEEGRHAAGQRECLDAWVYALEGMQHARQAMQAVLDLPAGVFDCEHENRAWANLQADAAPVLWCLESFARDLECQAPRDVTDRVEDADDEDEDADLVELEAIEADEPALVS